MVACCRGRRWRLVLCGKVEVKGEGRGREEEKVYVSRVGFYRA